MSEKETMIYLSLSHLITINAYKNDLKVSFLIIKAPVSFFLDQHGRPAGLSYSCIGHPDGVKNDLKIDLGDACCSEIVTDEVGINKVTNELIFVKYIYVEIDNGNRKIIFNARDKKTDRISNDQIKDSLLLLNELKSTIL